MAPRARVEVEARSDCFQQLALLVVGFVAAKHPRLTHRHGQSDDDGEAAVVLTPGLLEAESPQRLVVPVPDEKNRVESGELPTQVQNRLARRDGVRRPRNTLEVAVPAHAGVPRQMLYPRPGEFVATAGSIHPSPTVIQLLVTEPFDGVAQYSIRQLGRGVKVCRGFVNDREPHGHTVASSLRSQRSPKRLQSSPGYISSFHFGNSGWFSMESQTVDPSSRKHVILTSLGSIQSSRYGE